MPAEVCIEFGGKVVVAGDTQAAVNVAAAQALEQMGRGCFDAASSLTRSRSSVVVGLPDRRRPDGA